MIKNIQLIIFLMIGYVIVSCHSNKKSNESISTNIDSLNKDKSKQVIFDTLSYIKNNKRNGGYPYTSTDLLEEKDLDYISPSELRLIRNEIFAKNGYIFNTKELDQYFRKFEWYKPISKDVVKYLNEIENKNIELIKRFEKINAEITQKEQFAIFLDLIRSKKEIPRMLGYKFNESVFDNIGYGGYRRAEKILFDKSNTFKYILYRFFGLCDQCKYNYSIKKFSLGGELIDDIDLGECDEYKFEEKDDNVFSITFINYDNLRDKLDTVKWILKIDAKNNLIIK